MQSTNGHHATSQRIVCEGVKTCRKLEKQKKHCKKFIVRRTLGGGDEALQGSPPAPAPTQILLHPVRCTGRYFLFTVLSAYEAPFPKTMNNVPFRQEIRPPADADHDAGLLGNVRAQGALGKAGEACVCAFKYISPISTCQIILSAISVQESSQRKKLN